MHSLMSCLVICLTMICHLDLVSPLAVMSVDLGSEWMKVAIVSPGVPMEIVLNSDSQRKTPTVMTLRDDERWIGDMASNIGTRFPDKCFSHFTNLLGKSINSSQVDLYLKRFPFHVIKPHRDSISLSHPDGLSFTPEELVAMMLKRAQKYAQEASKQVINDVVITVEPYFSQKERRALLRAAKLANLKVLQIMNSNAAFALNYGVFRVKEFNTSHATNVVFYDQGAMSTIASIVSFQLIKTKERGFVETIPQAIIKGVGYDSSLGGLEMQIRLRDFLSEKFATQSGISLETVRKNNRAMAKLLKEAGRVKKVLSANTEHKSQVENVMNDKDLKTVVTREEFEQLCDDLLGERAITPLDQAFKSAGMTLSEIDQVIIVGGNTRIPKLQANLQKYIGLELGKSVNADEASALGAAYQAAHLSKGFKVKQFSMKDANLFPILVDFWRETNEGSRKTTSRTLFGRNNQFPQKKVLTFNKHTNDFEFEVNYGLPLPEDNHKQIGRVSLTGVKQVYEKHITDNSEAKGIKAHFQLNENGLLELDAIYAHFELKFEQEVVDDGMGAVVGDALTKFGKTISNLFGTNEDEDSSLNATDGSSDAQNGKESDSNGDDLSSPNETSSAPINETKSGNTTDNKTTVNGTSNETLTSKKEMKTKIIKEPIEWKAEILDSEVPDDEDLKLSESKLAELDRKEDEKLLREQSKNNLESFILETKDKLSQEEFELAATDSEKESLTKELASASDWLEYESDGAKTDSFTSKLTQLKAASKDLFERVREHRERPEALNALRNILNISEMFYKGAVNMSEDEQIFTQIELDTLDKLIISTKTWIDESVEAQNALKPSDNPKLLIRLIAEKIASLDREVKYLLNKARITPPKKKKEEKVDKVDKSQDGSKKKQDKSKGDEKQENEEKLKDESVKKNEEVKESVVEDVESPSESSSEPPSVTTEHSQNQNQVPDVSPSPSSSSKQQQESSHSEL